MSHIIRLVSLAAVLVVAACANEPGAKQCSTGIYCPANMQCAAVQQICLTNSCGNGVVDVGEQCDDGNIVDGDRCSAQCRREECGNGVIDMTAGEICDDGNTTGGDGCSPDCKSKELCGNGVKDTSEACDDGNMINGDGCSGESVMVGTTNSPGPCKSREVCGNGIVDVQVGEVCDDSNTTSGDGCNSDCRSGEGCGNGILDPGEQCDDGNSNDKDGCRNSCKLASCGDGVVNAVSEQCDGGDTASPKPRETATCNIDCTNRTCGDGKVNQTAGESCDNGLGNNRDTNNCTAGCLLNVCGDGKQDMQAPGLEQCDDGNQNNNDGCSNSCTSASCGNNIVDQGEQCDDGNTVDTDACVMCHSAVCGDNSLQAGVEQCDDGNTMNGDGCSSTCRDEVCGNGIINPGEQCDDGNTTMTDACLNNCKNNVCGDKEIRGGVEQCDDGNTKDGDGCSGDCKFEGCGNGTIDPGEQCDDNNNNPGDGCSSTCMFENCGDGVKGPGEQCDGHGESVGCNIDCTLALCDDKKVNRTAGEECDNGPVENDDHNDCTHLCKQNICGDHLVNTDGIHRELCDDGNGIDDDDCSNSCVPRGCGNGILDVAKGEQCDDGDTPGTVADADDGCIGCQYARCGDLHVNVGVEECDGDSNCSPLCTIKKCGNGILDSNEECDDGNKVSGDGCTGTEMGNTLAGCLVEFCGDGVKNNSTEDCDDEDEAGTFGCSPDCHVQECGNGRLDDGEECDDGNDKEDDDCVSNSLDPAKCKIARCGDSHTNSKGTLPNEDCDDGGDNAEDAPCLPTCLENICGDGFVLTEDNGDNTVVLETCDDGNANSDANSCPYGTPTCTLCRTDCKSTAAKTGSFCGDHVTNGGNGEECDDATVGTPTCPYGSATCTACSSACKDVPASGGHFCGDGNKDEPFETCDDNNSDDCGSCSGDCQTIQLAYATGLIVAAPADEITNGATLKVDDGLGGLVTLHFNSDEEPDGGGSNDMIHLSGNESAALVAMKIEFALGNSALQINPVADGFAITLTHDRQTKKGNVPIESSDEDIFVTGMDFGAGGNCPKDMGCGDDDDCTSGACVDEKCTTPP